MHLKIFLLAALVVCVCGRNVPDQSRRSDNLRGKRGALSKLSLLSENEMDDSAEFRKFLYNLEQLNTDGYDADVAASVEQPLAVSAPKNLKKVTSESIQSKPTMNKRAFAHNDFQTNQRTKKIAEERPESRSVNLYSQASNNYEEMEHDLPPKYDFKYAVNDAEHLDLKSHREERDGDVTVGEYSVLQPDGTILTVKYTVHGDEGFNAVVSKSEVPQGVHHKA